jgi:hypothetical protein
MAPRMEEITEAASGARRRRATVAEAWGWVSRHEYISVGALLLVVASLYFWPLLGGGQLGQSHILFDSVPWKAEKPPSLTVPQRSSELDVAYEYQPLLQVARAEIRDGNVPLWNPYSSAGMPLLGDMQEALLYPLTWIAILLPLNSAWGLIAVLKLVTAGLGTFALARGLRLSMPGSIVAAFVYMLSAPVVVPVQYPHGTVFSLFPWLILATDRIYRRPTAARTGALAVIVALDLFAGHPESAVLASAASLVYLVALALADRRFQGVLRSGWRIAGAWGGGHLLGVGLAGAAVVPFLQAYSVSISGDVHGLTRTRLPLSGLLLWMMPNVFGDAQPHVYPPDFSWTYFSTVSYFGVVALLLGGVAVIRFRRKPVMFALLAMAAAALLIYRPCRGCWRPSP